MLNPTTYKYGDLKYYYQIHVERQKLQGNIPLKYDQFIKRVRKMSLHDAIYMPRTNAPFKRDYKHPIQDNIRRTAMLKQENVQILDFDEMAKLENISLPETKKQTKPSLLSRFISLFK